MSRKPDNTRVKLPHINTKITILCRWCLGDRWVREGDVRPFKYPCHSCSDGTQEIFLIERKYGDVEVTDRSIPFAVLRGLRPQ